MLQIELRELDLSDELERAGSGLVKIKGKEVFFLDSRSSIQEQIKSLMAALKDKDLSQIYISPYLRKLLEAEDEQKNPYG